MVATPRITYGRLGSNLRFCRLLAQSTAHRCATCPNPADPINGKKQNGPTTIVVEPLIGTAGFEPATP